MFLEERRSSYLVPVGAQSRCSSVVSGPQVTAVDTPLVRLQSEPCVRADGAIPTPTTQLSDTRRAVTSS
ncbi:hypothetical protein EYF80_065889 [Liparis tanakae]|uniref:Uncharacterized protein n=1 Tax=Liparis tanakae TaxID=230148 RepID=A0A4Z2E5C4_9TELE|nr:hypothetical protein EYF80_065889 [Liparis tanakae]